jgi:hypothetical protein
MGTDAMSSSEARALASELAALSLEDAAPEELVLFPEVEEEFFRDPEALLQAQGRDEAVGFGLDVAMLTPYALAVVVPVIKFLASVVQDTAKEEVTTSLSAAIRRHFKRDGDKEGDHAEPAAPAPALALTQDQARQVRQTAFDQARGLGVDDSRAGLLADSLVGRLVVG